jgi:4-amino-4-deoxy-L-arabinose transferase-like glycosyltransferase
MRNLTSKEKFRMQWCLEEIGRGWLALVAMFGLVAISEFAERWLNRGWSVVVAVIATILWFILRPWRFGLLSGEVRRELRGLGAIWLCLIVALKLVRYWVP